MEQNKNTAIRSDAGWVDILVIAWIIIIIGGLLFLAWFFFAPQSTSYMSASENARRARCMSNLKQIAFGLKTYALDYQDALPWDRSEPPKYYRFFGKLHPGYLDSLSVFQCPSSTDEVMQVKHRRIPRGLFKESECKKGLSYAYGHNRGEPWTEESPSTTSIAADKYATQDYTKDPFPKGRYPNHWRAKIKYIEIGRNVVRLDASAGWDNHKTPLEADTAWDVKAGVSVTDPQYEPNEESDPKHDQTGPDWWSDPPDK